MNQKEATLIIPAIEQGTVIDHIPAGLGIKMLHLLHLENASFTVTVALRLRSYKMGFKDLIKIENFFLSDADSHKVAVFAPQGTINIIKNFTIQEKIHSTLPPSIDNILVCPNTSCITRHEKCPTFFFVKEHKHKVYLTCKYCQKDFLRDGIKDYIL
jgi:aspartate carbamoyltransferase regulatory subunit